MNTPAPVPHDMPLADAAPPDDALAIQPGSSSDARIAHLFRAARRQGLIHPLQHLLQRHRSVQPDGSAP